MYLNLSFDKTRCRLLFLTFLAFFTTTHTFSQSQNTIFTSVKPEKLSNSFIRCVIKDSKGFMWFGTAGGVVRYDGTNIYNYEHNPEDSTSICHNNINAIIEDGNQNIWIGTAQGLMRYNREKDNFINIDFLAKNSSLNNAYITTLCADNQGNLWIGTFGGGINIYNPTAFKFNYIYENNSKEHYIASDYITSFLLNGNTMWVGSRAGIKLFDCSARKPLSSIVIDKKVSTKQVTKIASDHSGNIWIGTANGEINQLVRQDKYYRLKRIVQGKNIYGSNWNNILVLCSDPFNNIWVTAENSGLNYLNVGTNKITQYLPEDGNPYSLPTSSIWSVYVDNLGMTWVGTYNKGIYLIDNHAKKFESYQRNIFNKNSLSGNDIKGFAEDKNGGVWIASDGGGLNKINLKKHELLTYDDFNKKLKNKSLTSIVCDADQNLWIGTWGQGVYKINPRNFDLLNYNVQSSGMGNNKILCLYEDKKKNIWAGTAGSGLFYFDIKTGSFLQLCEEHEQDYISKTSYVSCIFEDIENTLWVGTLYGLYALKRKENNSYTYTMYLQNNQPGGLSSSRIQVIHEDNKKNLWFGTVDNGLNLLTRGSATFKVFQKRNGLPSNTVSGILTDAHNNLWISSNEGLSKFNPYKSSFKNYTKEDGLNSNQFYVNSCLRTSNGELLFGGYKGFNAFYPDSIMNNPIRPIVYFSDLKINNQSVQIGAVDSPLKKNISLTTDIELSYEQRSFIIDFVAINYGQSSRNRYKYKLEGFEENWSDAGSNHSATYTNIDPGYYVFMVKASNSDGVWSQVPARLNIVIYPPLWKTWWAILLYLLSSSIIIFFLVKIRLDRIKIKNQLTLERLEREKEHELSLSKTQFFTNISHEFRTPLSLIVMPLDSVISGADISSSIKDRLITAHKNARKLMQLVNELMDFSKLDNGKIKLKLQHGELVSFITEVASSFNDVSKRRDIHFTIDSKVSSLNGWFDFDKLEKILMNILSNAFKFTADGGQIKIIINAKEIAGVMVGDERTSARSLEVTIIDNGVGISPEEIVYIFDKFYQAKSASKTDNPGTGIGLSLTKGLLDLHHGNITVESTPDHETKFLFTLPIDRHAYSDEDIVNTPVSTRVTKSELEENPSLNNAVPSTEERPDILIVEDNDELRKYLAIELLHEFNVIEAKNGKEGIEIAFEKIPDLIISDILMPTMTGIELCKVIKSDIKTSHIPIILLTAKTTIEDQIHGIETGADIYITKPFSILFLTTHVKQIIGSRQKLYSLFSQDVYLMPSKIAKNEIDRAFLQKTIDYIIENIQNTQLSIESIADLFNISRAQVYRKIKALTGKTAVEFIRTVRLKQALKLMETNVYTLSEIAYQTGFNSASYFTRSFKEQYGKAPSDYLENKS